MFFIAFTGQGSQKSFMGKDFFDNFEVCNEIMKNSEESLGYKISEIIFREDGAELNKTINTQFREDRTKLNKTINTQPAIMINGMMIYKALCEEIKEFEKNISLMAGHSVGEYNALCASGLFDIKTGVQLLKQRATFMENSCPNGLGSMVALIKVNNKIVNNLIKNEQLNGMICEIANDNGGEQIIVSGETQAIDILCGIAKTQGIRAIKLNVSGPFHSSLMKKASEEMHDELEKHQFQIHHMKHDVISNVTTDKFPKNEKEIKDLLAQQIISPVKWRETILNAYNEYKIKHFVEIGPSNVLTKLIKATLPEDIEASCVSNIEELKIFKEKYQNL